MIIAEQYEKDGSCLVFEQFNIASMSLTLAYDTMLAIQMSCYDTHNATHYSSPEQYSVESGTLLKVPWTYSARRIRHNHQMELVQSLISSIFDHVFLGTVILPQS